MSPLPYWLGLVLCTILNLLAGAAALGVALRATLAGRAELAMASIITWHVLVLVPVCALGLAHQLEAKTLASVSTLWFLLILMLARGSRPPRQFAGEIWQAAIGILRLPWDAFLIAIRARSLVAGGLVFTLGMLAWTFACAYLTPSWKQWDALWYHEPMVGFAIQNHGFEFVNLPWGGAQKINGYPRLCEMTQLWFAIFTDRRVIDMVGHVAAPILGLGVYALCRRYTSDQLVAIAFGCAILLMPASAILLGSVYVDLHNAAFVIAGAYFVTRPAWRLRDAVLAAIGLALAVGSKQMALVPVGMLCLVALFRLLARLKDRPRAVLGVLASAMLLVGGVAGMVYLRNWLHFGNPFWPDLKYDNPAWGIHWQGLVEWGTEQFEKGSSRIDMNLPLPVLLKELYQIPYTNSWGYYGQIHEYGIGMAWLVIPVSVAGFFALVVVWITDRIGVAQGDARWLAPPETLNLAPLALTLAAMVRFSPALWSARYQIAAMALALALVAWVSGRPGFRDFGQGVAGAVMVLGVVSFFWITPRTWLWPSEALAFARIPFPQRELTPAAEIGPDLPVWSGSPILPTAGLARERELGPGSVLVFSEDYGAYLSLFWNNRFSNRVVYLPQSEDFAAAARRLNATWVYCSTVDPDCHRRLSAPNSGWERVGPLDVEYHGWVYRRSR